VLTKAPHILIVDFLKPEFPTNYINVFHPRYLAVPEPLILLTINLLSGPVGPRTRIISFSRTYSDIVFSVDTESAIKDGDSNFKNQSWTQTGPHTF